MTAAEVLVAELRAQLAKPLPCGHQLGDLIGGTEPDGRPAVTKCGACLAARQAARAPYLIQRPLACAGADGELCERPREPGSLFCESCGRTERDAETGVCPCGGCVSCACCVAPRVDEDGLCTGCGGQPVALVVACGLVPHVGVEVEDADDRAKIATLLEQHRTAQAIAERLTEGTGVRHQVHIPAMPPAAMERVRALAHSDGEFMRRGNMLATWNAVVPPGSPVAYRQIVGGPELTSRTRSRAWAPNKDGEPMVLLEGHTGGFCLDFVRALNSSEASEGGS